jgi:hypothetical protein
MLRKNYFRNPIRRQTGARPIFTKQLTAHLAYISANQTQASHSVFMPRIKQAQC